MDELTFTQIGDKLYPQKQLVSTFFISDRILDSKYIEVRPLTFKHLICAVARNEALIFKWSFIRWLYNLGFIDIPEYEAFSWKYFRVNFWSERKISKGRLK